MIVLEVETSHVYDYSDLLSGSSNRTEDTYSRLLRKCLPVYRTKRRHFQEVIRPQISFRVRVHLPALS
jgi:hypothetical protein